MKNFKFNFKKPNFKLVKRKIKKIFSNAIVRTIIISVLTVVVAAIVIASVLYQNREKILKYISLNYPQVERVITIENPINNTIEKISVSDKALDKKENGTIVNTVKMAKPAVVSIIITKDVPKYKTSYKEESVVDTKGNIVPGMVISKPIQVEDGTQKKQIGSGSGFIVSSDGLIVTNNHVVQQKDVTYTVLLNSGGEYVAEVLARDSILDVALIKIKAKNLPFLELADSDKLEVGESVVAIGNALGEFKNSVSAGVVSGLSRSITAGDHGQTEKLEEVIQTDAAINEGNSGGPLLNLESKVVGINVAVIENSSSIGFSLPINSVKEAIDSVKKIGKIIRPYLGIRYIVLDSEAKDKYKLSVDYGILIKKGVAETDTAVISGSPAEKAGIKEGDIILAVNGQNINTDNDFAVLVRGKKIGSTLTLKVLSGGVEKNVNITLEQMPDGI